MLVLKHNGMESNRINKNENVKFSFQADSYWNVTLYSFGNRAKTWRWTRRVPPGRLWRLCNEQVTWRHSLEESKLQIHHKSYTLIVFWTPCTIPSGTNQRVLLSVVGTGRCEAIQKHLRLVFTVDLSVPSCYRLHTQSITTPVHSDIKQPILCDDAPPPPFNCLQSLSKGRNKDNVVVIFS